MSTPDASVKPWLEALEGLGHYRHTVPRECIILAGQQASHFYYIENGEVRLFKTDTKGRDIEIRRARDGQIFAEVFVFAGQNYAVSAESVTACTLISFAKADVLARTRQHPDLAEFFLKTLARRCLQLNQSIENLSLDQLPVRLARYVANRIPAHLAEPLPKNLILPLPIPKKALAEQLGTVPETLSRTLDQLHRDELLTIEGKIIRIPDPARLFEFIR